MYQREKSIWQKHLDFIILDVLCFQIAFIAAFMLRHGLQLPYMDSRYRNLGIIIALVQICAGFFLENYKNILRRGYFEEFKKTFLMVTAVIMVVFTYFFVTKTSDVFSRAVFLQLWVIGGIFIWFMRLVWKRVIRKRMQDEQYLQSLILISTRNKVKETVERLTRKKYTGFYIHGIILTDSRAVGGRIGGIPVVSDAANAPEYLRSHVVDEVFIDAIGDDRLAKRFQDACDEMGITTHLNIGVAKGESTHAIVETFVDYQVITNSICFAEPRQLFVKRVMDSAGGIVGLVLTALLTLIFGPIIYFQSPGPIFFSQERVGRSGRKFKIYKFRSMYPDAEERKKELMEQNKMQGLMFKMDNDPRIIPIGRFMRRTSLDEFPQFLNVLKGDMSLVGTRPPTVDEYEQYEQRHRARLAAKPGLTGMWQVSGRSDIVDFEEVVKLDMKYIHGWNIGLDLRIIFLTVKNMFTGEGSV